MKKVKIEYTYHFEMPREQVWNYIQNEQVLKKSLPGCKSFEQVGESKYHAEMGLSVGPVKGVFTGEVQQVDQEAPRFYRLLVKGKGKPGEIDAVAGMELEESGNQSCKLTCIADVQVTGLLASVGQRVMGGVAKLILGQFFKEVEKEMKRLAG